MLVRIYSQQKHRGHTQGLILRYEEPFHIVGQMSKVACKLESPPKLKNFHLVFHISLLKPYHEDMENSNKIISKRAPSYRGEDHI